MEAETAVDREVTASHCNADRPRERR